MRIAVVDMLFSWPPHGGADVDLWQMMLGLQGKGHLVHLIGVKYGDSWERGDFTPDELPFPATRLDFLPRQFTPKNVGIQIRNKVDDIKPDLVFVGDGFFFKPFVINALQGYKIVSRYYAYEFVCQKDILHFRDGKPCEKSYLSTPDFCRKCAFDALGGRIRKPDGLAWTLEYVAAKAYSLEYYQTYLKSCSLLDAAIVYNQRMAAQIRPYCGQVHVVPGGVDLEHFSFSPLPSPAPNERKIILMTGRAEDPAKGLAVLREAGRLLAEERDDFVIQATLPEDMPESDWFQPVGWRPHDKTPELYQQAHICVVPSVWEEPFGLVALEAMACGRVVVVSQVGGLQEIVEEGLTGLHFPAGDAKALAVCLSRLLDEPELCKQMGEAGRRRAEVGYSWQHIVEGHYLPILEGLQ